MGADAAVSDDATDWLARGSEAPGAKFVRPEPGGRAPQVGQRSVPPVFGNSPAAGIAPAASGLPVAGVSPASGGRGGLAPARSSSAPRTAPLAPAAKPPQRVKVVEAATLGELEAQLRAFDGCGLKSTATNLCFFRGAAKARLMVIGEAPGRDEDLEGRPFVGPAGRLLDKMLASIGLDETSVHITNIVYWRPPGNRAPSPQEALACRPFLDRQVALAAPDVVLLLGGSATKHILGTDDGIMRIRGNWADADFGGRIVTTMATLHPAYLLRTPASKRQVWRDLLAVKQRLRSSDGLDGK